MRTLLLTLFVYALMFVPVGMYAADPECVSLEEYDEAIHGQYDATQQIQFCTPETDANGDLLLDGEITSCTVTAQGQPFALTSTQRPGAYISFTVPQSVKDAGRFGSFEVFCSNDAGDGEAAVASNARFRDAGPPGLPTLRQP